MSSNREVHALILSFQSKANKEEGEENKLSSKWIEMDMSWLRYKDLDFLEGIFKLWKSEGRDAMNLKNSFRVRLKPLLGKKSLPIFNEIRYEVILIAKCFQILLKVESKLGNFSWLSAVHLNLKRI